MKRSDTKLTERFVNMLRPPAEGQKFYWDSETKGFGVGITSGGTRTYVAQKRINGKTVRLKIGGHGVWNADDARMKAKEVLLSMDKGADPREEKRRATAASLTLRSLAEDYCAHRKARSGLPLKERTKADIERHINSSFKDWAAKPVSSITPDACLKRFREMSATGPVHANQAMRILRALLNYARDNSETVEGVPTLLPVNPVSRIKKQWNAEVPREGRVPHDQIGRVWNWLQERRATARTVDDRTSADAVCLLLLSGARLGEMTSLKWEDVKLDDDSGSFHLADPKNRRAVTLPLNAPARAILTERLALRDADDEQPDKKVDHTYVFQTWSATGHITEVKGTMAHVSKVCGVHVTAHDLRRTFTDVAEEAGVFESKLKQLINHLSGDVTGKHYANNRDPRKLAAASEAIGAWIVEQGALAAGKNVIALRA